MGPMKQWWQALAFFWKGLLLLVASIWLNAFLTGALFPKGHWANWPANFTCGMAGLIGVIMMIKSNPRNEKTPPSDGPAADS